MAARGEQAAGRKRDAAAAMLDDLGPPPALGVGALQAEVLAAASLALDPSLEPTIPVSTTTSQATPPPSGSAGPLVAPLDTLIPVPELDRRDFDSWEDFHAHLLDYGRHTFQLYSVRSATPSTRRNLLLAKKAQAKPSKERSRDAPLIPERFQHYVKTITCTHGGKPRHRSTGARPNHHHRAIQCPAQINACVKRDARGWRVHVTNQHAWHNHEVSEPLYRSYPEVRNALGDDVLATVNILRKAEAKRKKILEYILEHSAQQPKMKDVHNLLSKLKRRDEQGGAKQ